MKYDVCVIGGGPAGMMAAGRAGERGVRVILVEKNENLGVKLLISGKGRCNITNNTGDVREMVKMYGKNGNFLFSALNKFGVQEIVDFFETRGVKTKVERGNRVFPASDKSRDVLNVLIKYLKKSQVLLKTNRAVKKIVKKGDKIEKIVLSNNEEIIADKFIICTGGKSYPKLGSTGDAYEWLKKLDHKITDLHASLTPVIVKESFIKNIEGLSLKNVEISIYQEDIRQRRTRLWRKIDSRFGEAIFTFNGMSGPIILDLSKKINQELNRQSPLRRDSGGEAGELLGKIKMQIDFKPALDFAKLDKRLQRDFVEQSNKMFKNSLDKLLPQKLIPVIIKLSEIDPEKKVNLISREERKKLLHLLKEFTLEIKGVIGFGKAIVTSGGVDLREVDPKTMQSKLIDNLYFAGEILDLDGPTGGYNLQVCWSTGYAAGDIISPSPP